MQQWKKVDEAMQNEKPKTALELVEKIYTAAKTRRDYPQIIKAIAYRVSLHAEQSEDGERKLIAEIQAETDNAKQPVRWEGHRSE